MKRLLIAVIALTSLWSCTTARKYQHDVVTQIQKTGYPTPKSDDRFSFDFTKLPKQDTLFTVHSTARSFIPAIIVWTWQNTFDCSLAPQIPAGHFSAALRRYADSMKLTKVLDGRRLELQVEEVPHEYVHSQNGFTLFLVIAAATQEENIIIPKNSSLKVRYTVWSGADVVKRGIISVTGDSKSLKNNMKTAKKLAWWYLDRQKKDIEQLTKQFTARLIREIGE